MPEHSLSHSAILNFKSLRFLLLIPLISQPILHILFHPFLLIFYSIFFYFHSYLYFCTFSPYSAHFSAYSFSSLSFAFLFYVLLFSLTFIYIFVCFLLTPLISQPILHILFHPFPLPFSSMSFSFTPIYIFLSDLINICLSFPTSLFFLSRHRLSLSVPVVISIPVLYYFTTTIWYHLLLPAFWLHFIYFFFLSDFLLVYLSILITFLSLFHSLFHFSHTFSFSFCRSLCMLSTFPVSTFFAFLPYSSPYHLSTSLPWFKKLCSQCGTSTLDWPVKELRSLLPPKFTVCLSVRFLSRSHLLQTGWSLNKVTEISNTSWLFRYNVQPGDNGNFFYCSLLLGFVGAVGTYFGGGRSVVTAVCSCVFPWCSSLVGSGSSLMTDVSMRVRTVEQSASCIITVILPVIWYATYDTEQFLWLCSGAKCTLREGQDPRKTV